MIDKKKIIAIVVFVFFGLFMFTFANPADDDLKENGNKTAVNVINKPVITLGNNVTSMEVFGKIPTFTATSDSGEVVITNNINPNVVGTYTVTVTATNAGGTTTVTFDFVVADTTAPVLTLLGDETVIIRKNDEYVDAHATAMDNYDGNITNKIIATNDLDITKMGTYNYEYNVSDAALNKAIPVNRNVIVTDADKLSDIIDEANKIIDGLKDLDLRDDLKDLLDELLDEVEKGNTLIDDHQTPQDEIDDETNTIEELIEKIKNLKFTVKYVDYNDNEIASYTVKYMETAMIPSDPARLGYTFTGWDKVAKNVVNDLVIKATYKINSYKLTINTDKGIKSFKVNGNELKDTYNYNDKIVITYNLKKGYKDTTTDTLTFNMDAKDMKVNLSSETIIYNITYNLNNGIVSGVNPSTYTVETDTFTLINPTRVGYTFTGWNKKFNYVQKVYKGSTGDKEFTALWTANINTKYTVEHYIETLDNDYKLVDKDTKYGITDTNTKAYAKKYAGFTSKAFKQENINGDGSTVIKIYYTRNNYKLIINQTAGINSVKVNGEDNKGSYKYGEAINITYKIANGYYDLTLNATKFNMPATNTNIILAAAPQIYTIKYDLDGGVLNKLNPLTYTIISNDIKLNNPIKAGYTFKGWNSDGNTNVVIKSGSTGNKEYTALWTANTNTKYTVKHLQEQLNGSYKEVDSETLTGTTDKYTNAVAKKYDGFTSKAFKQENINGNGSTIIKIYYTRNSYKLIINKTAGINSVKVNDSKTYDTFKYGSDIKITYGLDNGYSDKTTDDVTFTMGSANKTVNLKAIPTVYTITYKLNGGENSKLNPTDYTITSKDIKLSNPTRTGYTFIGWNSEGNTNVVIKSGSTGNKEYTALWKINTVTISYYNGNTKVDSKTVDYNSYIDLSLKLDDIITAKDTKKFLGWTYDNKNNFASSTDKVTNDVKLYAKYSDPEINTYKVTYYYGLNNALTKTVSLKYGDRIDTSFKPDNFQIDDMEYTFKEWQINNGKVDSKYTISGNTSVYAKYDSKKIQFTVTFNAGEGHFDLNKKTINVKVNKGENAVAPKDPIYKDKTKTFAGWDKEFNNVTGNITVNAIYEAYQTGIVATLRDNMQVSFTKNEVVTSEKLAEMIAVYKKYSDGTVDYNNEVVAYTHNIKTNVPTDGTKLIITEVSTNFKDDELKYFVRELVSFNTKFEVRLVENKVKYSNKDCVGLYGNLCDQGRNVTEVNAPHNLLEIIEHYDEAIEINDVEVVYTNGYKINRNSLQFAIDNTKNKNAKDGSGSATNINTKFVFSNDVIRWSYVTHTFSTKSTFDPVYIAKLSNSDINDDKHTIKEVNIKYDITINNHKYSHTITFERQNDNTFKAVREV